MVFISFLPEKSEAVLPEAVRGLCNVVMAHLKRPIGSLPGQIEGRPTRPLQLRRDKPIPEQDPVIAELNSFVEDLPRTRVRGARQPHPLAVTLSERPQNDHDFIVSLFKLEGEARIAFIDMVSLAVRRARDPVEGVHALARFLNLKDESHAEFQGVIEALIAPGMVREFPSGGLPPNVPQSPDDG